MTSRHAQAKEILDEILKDEKPDRVYGNLWRSSTRYSP
jgi:hypothetical protein